MVVLAASILEKKRNGRVLFSRQSKSMTKVRIESLLQAFPKLINEDQQHTFVETDQVRYVYQAMEEVYVVLITNKQSNIVEDLDTLRLLAKLIPDECGSASPHAIIQNGFELVFAVDEVLSMGLRESVTLQQIRGYVQMDSHEEKLQQIITQNKQLEAKRLAMQKAEELDRIRQQQRQYGYSEGGSGMVGFGNDSGEHSGGGSGYMHGGMGGDDDVNLGRQGGIGSGSYKGMGMGMASDIAPQVTNTSSVSSNSSGSSGSGSGSGSGPTVQVLPKKALKGMSLSKSSKNDAFLSAFKSEEKLPDIKIPTLGMSEASSTIIAAAAQAGVPGMNTGNTSSSSSSSSSATTVPSASTLPRVIVQERVKLVLDSDGSAKSMDIEGQLKVNVLDPSDAKIKIKLNNALNTSWKPQTRPGMDKQLFTQKNILAMDETKSYPIGLDANNVILRWKQNLKDSECVPPFTVNFWSASEGDKSVVTAEFNAESNTFDVTDVEIWIPCSTTVPPTVANCDGTVQFTQSRDLVWLIPSISSSSNPTGSLEFSIPEINHASFFPIRVKFRVSQPVSGLSVLDIVRVEGEQSVKFNQLYDVYSDNSIIE